MSKNEDDNEDALNAEVEWGRTYRRRKKEGRKVSMVPVSPPLNIQMLWEQYQVSKEMRKIKELKRKLQKRPIEITQKRLKGRVDPDVVSKKTYYNYMSTPRYKPEPPPLLPKLPKLDKKECSPRLIYLSKPTKRRVLHTWRDHRCSLPIDFIARLEELLQANHNLDPEFARCYFKNLDRVKRRERNKLRRRMRKKKRKQLMEPKLWLQVQVEMTAYPLVKFLKKESLFSLNFKQMMISEAILSEVHEHGHIKKIPPRNSSKPYSRAVVDIADQLSVWVDTIMRYVDVQYTDSVEAILEVPSLMSEFGEEEEEEEESPRRFSLPPLPPLPDMPPLPDIGEMPFIMEEGEDGIIGSQGADVLFGRYPADRSMTDGAQPESQATIDESSLQEDALQSLIQILSISSPEMLQQWIDPSVFPEVTYDEVLGKLRVMKDKTEVKQKQKRAEVLEKVMTDWATTNSPERVNEPIVGKIHSTAGILSECLGKDRQSSLPPAYIDVRSVSEGILTTGELSYPISGGAKTAEMEEKTLTTLEEEVSSATSGGELSQFGEDDVSTIGKYIGAKQSKIQLPTMTSNASRVNKEPSQFELHQPTDTTSDLKVVMGEVPSPELSYVLRLTPKTSTDTGAMPLDVTEGQTADKIPTSVSASTPPATATGSPPATATGSPPDGSGSPRVSTSPGAPGSPGVPTPPGAPGSPRLSTPPGAPGSPRLSTPPGAPGSPRLSTPPGASGSPRLSSSPGAPGTPRVSTPTSVPCTPRISTPTGVSDSSRVSTPPCATGSPRVSTPPCVTGSPRVSTPPCATGSPRVSTPPCATRSPRVSTPPCATGSPRTPTPPCAVPSSRLPLQPYGLPAGLSKSGMQGVIPAHMPSKVFEHQPDTICCLTLKVWASWLLEVAHNAHGWSRWLNDIINEVRRIASVIRGEVKDDFGNPVVFYREDWIEFSEKIDNMITSWRQYSMHVKDLTDKIVRNFRGKNVTCCPKCLEDNLIVDATLAHNISQQLAEAMNTAGYWRRWLDSVVMETKRLTGATLLDHEPQLSSYGTMEIIELHDAHVARSEESLYEIDEIDL